MIRVQYFLVANYVIREAETGNLSVIGLFEDIIAESYPVFIAKLNVIAKLIKGDGDDRPKLRLHIYNNQTKIGDYPVSIDFRGKQTTKTIIKVNGIPIREAGEIVFKLLKDDDGTLLSEYPITLKLREDISVTPS